MILIHLIRTKKEKTAKNIKTFVQEFNQLIVVFMSHKKNQLS